jgi:hypothetical protein
MAAASRVVAAGGFVYVEAPQPLAPDVVEAAGLGVWRSARAGAVHFHLLRRPAAA